MNFKNFFNRLSYTDKLMFTKHLSVMVKSGIPLLQAVDIIVEQTTSPILKKILSMIRTDISNGQSLHDSMAKHPEAFDQFYLSMVGAAEESGNLEKNLEYLAVQMQKTYEFRKKVSGAMMYPAFIVIMALVLGGGITIFVLPQMSNLFASLDIELPITTKILLGTTDLMKNYGFIIIPGFFGFISLSSVVVNMPAFRFHWHTLLLKIPIFGKFLQQNQIAALCRNLGLMLKSGLPISQALGVLVESTDNMVYRRAVEEVRLGVEKGKTIESVLSQKKYWQFPLIVSRMIGVGEKTGKIDESFLYLADFFEEEVDNTAKNLPTVLEPILLTVIALIVAGIALAIISPIYQFTASVRR